MMSHIVKNKKNECLHMQAKLNLGIDTIQSKSFLKLPRIIQRIAVILLISKKALIKLSMT